MSRGIIRPRPCGSCPVRATGAGAALGASLYRARREEIRDSVYSGASFECHSEGSNDEDTGQRSARECAGVVSILMREGRANMPMRIQMVAEADGLVDEFVPADEDQVPWATMDEWAAQNDNNR